jgi:hypothetical protein
MPDRQDESPDDYTAIVRAVVQITGQEPMTHEEAAESFADPETPRKYREAMAKEREPKAAKAAS